MSDMTRFVANPSGYDFAITADLSRPDYDGVVQPISPSISQPTQSGSQSVVTTPLYKAPLREGDICTVCGHVWKRRQLWMWNSFVYGCMC